MWLILASLVTLVVLFYLFRTRNANYWRNKGVPTASGYHWFFGHYKALFYKERHLSCIISDVYYEFPESSLVGYYQMSIPVLLIKEPDIIKSILTTDFSSFSRNQFMVDKSDFLLGNNPFVLWGDTWKKTRAHVTPGVTFMKLKGYLPAMLSVGDELVQYVRRNFDENGVFELEAKEVSSIFTLDVVANAVLGVKNNGFVDKKSIIGLMTENIFDSIFINNLRSFVQFLFPDVITSTRFTSKQSEVVLLSLTRKMLKEKAESPEISTDLFYQLLAARKNNPDVFTDEYIASNVYSFLLDGYETSSILLSYTLFELAWHKDVQEKLRAEVRELLSRTKGEPTAEQIEGLKYLDMVVSESLRLHPPAPLLLKRCTQPYTFNDLKGCKNVSINIEEGTIITIPIMVLHLDPKYYPSPEQFDPERFSETEVAKRHKFVFLPFGEGPRRCLGQRFGLLQVKVAIMKTVEQFHLKPSPKSTYAVTPDPQIFMVNRPLNGAWIQMEKLN